MKNDKYMKVLEILGEVIMNKEEDIRYKEYELETLKQKIEKIEQQMNNTL